MSSTTHDDVACEVCELTDRSDIMLLCDRCDRAFHITCVDPPLASVPDGDWYCADCVVGLGNFSFDAIDRALALESLDDVIVPVTHRDPTRPEVAEGDAINASDALPFMNDRIRAFANDLVTEIKNKSAADIAKTTSALRSKIGTFTATIFDAARLLESELVEVLGSD